MEALGREEGEEKTRERGGRRGRLAYPGALRPPGGRRALFGQPQANGWLLGLPQADRPPSAFPWPTSPSSAHPEADGGLFLIFFRIGHMLFKFDTKYVILLKKKSAK